MVLHRSQSTERVLTSFAALDRRNEASSDRRASLEKLVLEATDTAWHQYVKTFVVRHDRLSGEEPKERLVSKLMAEPLFSLPSPSRRHRNPTAAFASKVEASTKSKWLTGAPARRRYLQSPPKRHPRTKSWSNAVAAGPAFDRQPPLVMATRDALDDLMSGQTNSSCSTGRGPESNHDSSITASTDSSCDGDRQRQFGKGSLEADAGDALDAFVYDWHAKKILKMFH